MIACQCLGVTDREIRKAVTNGASTILDVGMLCRAGTDCGGCHATIERIIHLEAEAARTSETQPSCSPPNLSLTPYPVRA